MRATKSTKLTAIQVKNAKPNAILSDGGGLYLRRRVWVFRYTSPITGKERDLSLGSAQSVELAAARDRAIIFRSQLAEKKDPHDVIAAQQQAAAATAAASRTFGDIAAQWCDEVVPSSRKSEHNQRRVRSAISTHTKSLTKIAMVEITSKQIADAVKPLADRPTQRDNVVSLIHSIFDWAMNSDLIPERLNPARRAKLKKLGVNRDHIIAPVKHNTFVPLAALPAFMGRLEATPGNLPRALEFLIHTGLRQAEVTGLRWAYVDLSDRSLTIPAQHMKAGKAHRVFLSDHAHAIITGLLPQQRANGYVFPGGTASGAIGATSLGHMFRDKFPDIGKVQVHGARGSFKTWATTTTHRRELIELTLAHSIGSAVESAYFNPNDASIRKAREALYRDWSNFLRGGSNVVQFRAHG